MSDRFKFRIYCKGNEYIKAGYQDLNRNDVIFSINTDGTLVRTIVYECQQEDREGESCYMPFPIKVDLYDIQFCTGLKDKNHKLIYEGDILKCRNSNIFGFVSWDEHMYKVKNWAWNSLHTLNMEAIEVIGNIYENQELLENEE